MSFDDRRCDRRVSLDLPIAVVVGGQSRRFRLVDLSCTGAQIEHLDEVPLAPVHTLALEVDGVAIRLLARTVWSRGTRHAVRFLAMDHVDRLDIAEIIDKLELVSFTQATERDSGIFARPTTAALERALVA
jgi:hypothetical protein